MIKSQSSSSSSKPPTSAPATRSISTQTSKEEPSTARVPMPGTFRPGGSAQPIPRKSKAIQAGQTSTPSSMNPPVPKILFIGDSISAHADVKIIAEATKSRITTAKAYSSVFDEESNSAKQAAFYPNKNFLKVVPSEAIKDNFEHLIIQAGSVDISNLKTDENPSKHIEFFKQETVKSAQNIFNSGIIALERQLSLKRVIFLKQTPRYDPLEVDPLSLKPALSQLFNNTMVELWMNSPMKEHIFVGTHNIDCSGAVQAARYRHTKSGWFDGIHLYGSPGSKAYTLSVLNILRSASLIANDDDYHLSCAQYRYQNRQYNNHPNCYWGMYLCSPR